MLLRIDLRNKPTVAGNRKSFGTQQLAHRGNAHRPALQISPSVQWLSNAQHRMVSKPSSERPSQYCPHRRIPQPSPGRDRLRTQSLTGHRSRLSDRLSNIDFRVRWNNRHRRQILHRPDHRNHHRAHCSPRLQSGMYASARRIGMLECRSLLSMAVFLLICRPRGRHRLMSERRPKGCSDLPIYSHRGRSRNLMPGQAETVLVAARNWSAGAHKESKANTLVQTLKLC